ncbi:MAG: hydrogenase large subunit [Acidiferrobacter thiooxydans]
MPSDNLPPDMTWARLPGPVPTDHAWVDCAQWRALAIRWHAEGGQLVALWGSDERPAGLGFVVHAVVIAAGTWRWMSLAAGCDDPHFPALSDLFPAAARQERALFDLLGISCAGRDTRPWLRHGAWGPADFPLRRDFAGAPPGAGSAHPYPFVPVRGSGVHEIAVGPIHAGTIEPGHFRFSVVGDEILRLEERLGYTHKGVAKRLEGMPLAEGGRLVGRVCADSTAAYAGAYAMAVEAVSACVVPPRALWLRALLWERERIANHLGDLGALCQDGGLAFGHTQFGLLKERWLQTHGRLFGHRYLMDVIVPGGVACDLDPTAIALLDGECATLLQTTRRLQHIIDDHAGLQERFLGAGRLDEAQARAMGAVGLVARASGIASDLRVFSPSPPYDTLKTRISVRPGGDVAARVAVRFDEIYESLRLIHAILASLPDGPVCLPCDRPQGGHGLGAVEGWRGVILVAVTCTSSPESHHVHIHDPSWQNWPLLERAVLGELVPDFPLINKSFNLAYSGHDL